MYFFLFLFHIVPSVNNPTLMNKLMNTFCKGFAPLDSTFASMGIYYRNKSMEDSDNDLSDLIDIEESEIEVNTINKCLVCSLNIYY